jgi:hypothetical protein
MFSLVWVHLYNHEPSAVNSLLLASESKPAGRSYYVETKGFFSLNEQAIEFRYSLVLGLSVNRCVSTLIVTDSYTSPVHSQSFAGDEAALLTRRSTQRQLFSRP